MEQRTEPAAIYRTGKATVRIHAGQMTREEMQAAFEKASVKMRMEMERRGSHAVHRRSSS